MTMIIMEKDKMLQNARWEIEIKSPVVTLIPLLYKII
jgi:hypothetical protein